jgi:predicted CoA-binding protein
MAPITRNTKKRKSHQYPKSSFENSDATIRKILTGTRTIALVGASDKEERASNEVMLILQEYGYRVIPINPRLKGKLLLGEQVLGSLDELPKHLGKGRSGIEKAGGEEENEKKQESISTGGGGGVMVDIFRRSDSAGEIVDRAIALGGNLVSSIWMQIGVIDENAAQRAVDAGFAVAMNVCPAEEIPRLGISVPRSTSVMDDDALLLQQEDAKSKSKPIDSIERKHVSSPAKRRRT